MIKMTQMYTFEKCHFRVAIRNISGQSYVQILVQRARMLKLTKNTYVTRSSHCKTPKRNQLRGNVP